MGLAEGQEPSENEAFAKKAPPWCFRATPSENPHKRGLV
jgi:hypothetical protein